MGMNDTPSGERKHIAFFGCRNAGKSSLVNAFTNQSLSIVSETKGTTTDPVRKSMELLPLGPVVITDTPGIDDDGELGSLRVERTMKVLDKTDIAILVVDAVSGKCRADEELEALFKKRNIPWITVYNKCDLPEAGLHNSEQQQQQPSSIYVSALKGTGVNELREMTARILKELPDGRQLIGDLIKEGDKLILVIPIDKAAPKGRLILPQQQVIRDALDNGAIPLMCRDSELADTLFALKEAPRMVITDSQAFARVSAIVPESIPLTSFSILMARYKGNLLPSVEAAAKLKDIGEGDRILISEGCTHHRQCGDIGSVKLPALIKKFTGAAPQISLSSGTEFPDELLKYNLIIHCGACMLTEREAHLRYEKAAEQGIPITNYGTAIAYMNGILKRSLELFPEAAALI